MLLKSSFTYILKNLNYKIIKSNSNSLQVLAPSHSIYFILLHLKLSSIFFSTQLLDLFIYESSKKSSYASVIYYFFNLILNYQIILLTLNPISKPINSAYELFNNANWLEREASELSNLFFSNKKDTRNLMLQYGETSSPFKKSYPTIGYHELFYNRKSDSIISSKVSIQF